MAMKPRIIDVDSTTLSNIQLCARKAQYNNIYNLAPYEKGEALEKGDLMHRMLEVYYSLRLDQGPDLNSPTWLELADEANIHPNKDKDSDPDPIKTSIDAGIFFASKLSIESEVSEEVIDQFKAYCEYYEHDFWHPLAVEEVGRVVMYEDSEILISYTYKIDLVAEKGNLKAPFDHKTSQRRGAPSAMSNQFIGYCYATGLNMIVINKIGFQKSLKPSERFERHMIPISDDKIDEWRENTILWAKQWDYFHNILKQYPMNFTSCDKFGGCMFRRVCESDRENREWNLNRDFQVVEKWDVGRILIKEG
jgi:hypothetical protein